MNRRNFLKGAMLVPVALVAPLSLAKEVPFKWRTIQAGENDPSLAAWARITGVERMYGESDAFLKCRIIAKLKGPIHHG